MITSASRFLLALLVVSFVLVLVLFAPYLSVFVLAVVFGVMFEPVYRWLKRYLPQFLASILTTTLVVLLIAGPVAFVLTQIAREAAQTLVALQGGYGGASGATAFLQNLVDTWIPYANIDVAVSARAVLTWIASQAGTIFGSVLTVSLNIFLAIIALVYWFMDAKKMRTALLAVSPLTDEDTHNILGALTNSIHSVITGTLVVAMVQGVVAGVGFFIFGVPNALLWGSVAGICALLPMLGATLITAPAVAYLFLSGDIPSAIGMAAWAICAVGLIDNLIGPRLMSRGGHVHPFFILIAVLGGVTLFGPVGLFAGPLIVSFFFAVFAAYSTHLERHGNNDIV